ncbi:NepR family anti-sigma factor [Frigidibacter sp. SD6-1]|nr:NepR family anti-sigma factor [Frigidibacter sp. SD6-1]
MKEGDDGKSKLRAQIDENLKRVYQEALEERIPDHLRDLLDRLRQKEAGK